MKKLLFLFVLSINVFADTRSISCHSVEIRSRGIDYKVDSEIHFDITKTGENSYILDTLIGYSNVFDEYDPDGYKGIFAEPSALYNNPGYSPRKYKGYAQFKLDAVKTNDFDGGGMWGHFVIDVTTLFNTYGQPVYGHYIFQAGDHLGGTVDYVCLTKNDF